jgi:hypothetical protein
MMTTESVACSRSSNTLPHSRDAKRPSCGQILRPEKQRAQRYPKRGAGKAGCPLHPQPRVQRVESTRVRHHRSTGTPGLPCTMVLTVSFALSPVIGLVCHRRQQINSADLTPASRRQDHTTSPSASLRLRQERNLRPPYSAPRP